MLKIDNLSKSYGSKKVLDNISFSVNNGEIFGLVGPNGAGKTTTLKILSSVLKPDGGTMIYENTNLLENIPMLKRKIGYMPDFFGIYDNLTVEEYLEFYGSIYDLEGANLKQRIEELLYLVSLDNQNNSYVNNLSQGMKQRLCLARTLIHNPEIILLDEPTSGLDPRNRNDLIEILKHLKEQGKIVIISSHILSELSQMCSSMAILDEGKIMVSGKVNEISNMVDESNPLIITVLDNMNTAIELLRKNPLVKTLSVDEDKILITFTGNRKEESSLLQEMIFNAVEVVSFTREQGNLETLFLKITGGEL